MGRGAVAGGSPLTVQAGLHALSLGGNAVDGAIAASLMACVAEPLLTGLGGAGLAIIRMGDCTEVCDMFTNAPGKGAPGVERPDMKTILLDFGPTTQTFHVGPASVAVPGLPAGLRALHARYSTLPLATLARPAIESARKGYLVPLGFERVGRLLWPIQLESAETARIFGPNGERPWRAGDWFSCPPLADTIERYVSTDEPLFSASSGNGLPLLDTLRGHTALTEDDLQSYEPRFRPALSASYRDARVHVPGSPSVAGILILRALAHLEAGGPMPAALTGASRSRGGIRTRTRPAFKR